MISSYNLLKRIYRFFCGLLILILPSCLKETSTTNVEEQKPTVNTVSATWITSNGAILNGSVNSNGLQTIAWFEYGTSPTLSDYTASPNQIAGSDKSPIDISEPIINLSPKLTYYYRIAANNELGTTKGAILDFDTSAPSYNDLTGEWILSTTSFSNNNFTAALSADLNITQTTELLPGYNQDVFKMTGTFSSLAWIIQRKSDNMNYIFQNGSGSIINGGVNITVQSHNLEFDLASSSFHFRGVSALFETMTGDMTVKIDMTSVYGTSDGLITLTGMWEANRK